VQGLYALAHNYGSLAARLLFQPLEEAARLIFSRLAPQSPETTDKSRPSRENRGHAGLLLLLLRSLVKLVVLVGLVFSCLGFNYTRLLLSLLLGRGKQGQGGWGGEAAWLLSCYCVYVSALALNGMTEAFVYAVATHTQVHQPHHKRYTDTTGWAKTFMK
jgi:oligosaccharide translocation protein RFT1